MYYSLITDNIINNKKMYAHFRHFDHVFSSYLFKYYVNWFKSMFKIIVNNRFN